MIVDVAGDDGVVGEDELGGDGLTGNSCVRAIRKHSRFKNFLSTS